VHFRLYIFLFIFFFSSLQLIAQKEISKDSLSKKEMRKEKRKMKRLNSENGIYNPLSPSKAAFYSAILPGMGQIYNKKYWKAPIVWGALAIPVYYYQLNNSDYRRYRRAFKLRENGLIDEFNVNGVETVSTETLETAQKQLRENRDFSLLSGIILYVLQIVEASVNAHLIQFNTDDNLTFKPVVIPDPIQINTPTVGLRIKYTF
jgi:hypothetical protein